MNKARRLLVNEFDIPNLFRRYNPNRDKGNYEFYTQEFAYSTIYRNLKQENIPRIMELLCIKRLPRILFLIKVFECNSIYRTFPEFRVYPFKAGVVNRLEKCLKEKRIESVVASFLGRDTIGAFLCLEGESIEDPESRARLGKIAQSLIEHIEENNECSIAIGISEFCNNINHFPEAYAQCKEALRKNFKLGQGAYIFYGETEIIKDPLDLDKLDFFVMEAISYLDDLDNLEYYRVIDDMIGYIRNLNVSPIDVRLHMLAIINQIADYYHRLNIEKETIDLFRLDAMRDMLNSDFIDEVGRVIQGFCDNIFGTLVDIHQTPEDKIRLLVEECLEKFYDDSTFNLSEMANLCHYSPYYFGRLFKNAYGTSFNEYLNEYRITKSKELLIQSQLSVEEIAGKVGFNSASYFCTSFKKLTGLSPREFSEEKTQ